MKQPNDSSSEIAKSLKDIGVRPTRQRVLLGKLLFGKGCRHVTAECLFHEAEEDGVQVSLATVYNTLHTFTKAGLLKEIVSENGSSYFDTNTAPHHHFLCEETGELQDIASEEIALTGLPIPPEGSVISGVGIIIRTKSRS